MKYKDSNNEWQELVVKASDTLPIGAEVDYDGNTVPYGWEKVSGPNEYLTEEQVIGTWIDGKKIYRKVIQADITSGSNIIKVNDNIENIVDYTTYVTRTDNGTYIKDSYYVNDASHIIVNYIYSSKSIEVFVTGLTVSEVLILAEYTKTTE